MGHSANSRRIPVVVTARVSHDDEYSCELYFGCCAAQPRRAPRPQRTTPSCAPTARGFTSGAHRQEPRSCGRHSPGRRGQGRLHGSVVRSAPQAWRWSSSSPPPRQRARLPRRCHHRLAIARARFGGKHRSLRAGHRKSACSPAGEAIHRLKTNASGAVTTRA